MTIKIPSADTPLDLTPAGPGRTVDDVLSARGEYDKAMAYHAQKQRAAVTWRDALERAKQERDDAVRAQASLRLEIESMRSSDWYKDAEHGRDKARLDWFELHGIDIGVSTLPRGSRVVRWHRGDAYGNTVREAIDNAMRQLQILNDPDDEPQAGPAVE